MRTLHRRGLLTACAGVAAAVTAGSRAARADEADDATSAGGGSVRVRGTGDRAAEDAAVVAAVEPPAAVVVEPSAGGFIADFALGYVGAPYVAAGRGPWGFDCSGFTWFVVMSTLGVDIGGAVEGQPGAGYWVDWGAWAPGDLVFFQNTYRAGISHAGVYVGDGLFVHSQNEDTGVVVTSMYSDYYAARYWGANRLV